MCALCLCAPAADHSLRNFVCVSGPAYFVSAEHFDFRHWNVRLQNAVANSVCVDGGS